MLRVLKTLMFHLIGAPVDRVYSRVGPVLMRRFVSRYFDFVAWPTVVVIFLARLALGPAYPLEMLYIGPLLLTIWAPSPKRVWYLAGVSTALFVLATLIVPPNGSHLAAIVSRGIGTAALWFTAFIVSSYRRAETARERTVKDLADLRDALDQAAIVATTDVRGDITFVNDKFCEISGYTRAELLGRNHRLLNSGLHSTQFFREMYEAIAHGKVWRGEIRNRAKDGSLYWVDTTIVPFLDAQDRPYQYTAIRYDITERMRTEAALREQTSLVQLGKMAAIVAHEVRNPLAGIRGAMQVMGRRFPAGGAEHSIINEVIARVDTLNNIVQDLLLFARPRQPVMAEVRVSQLVDQTLSLLQDDPKYAGVSTSVEGGDLAIIADASQLQLVLLNLLINGAQAMAGRGEIRIFAEDTDGWHELRVIDQGPGIPEDVREHLFEPFFTTKHRGTGLGLATARRILESHGGTLALECPPAGGTVAIVRLPASPTSTG
jgi:PAS domain S-box-containing protein